MSTPDSILKVLSQALSRGMCVNPASISAGEVFFALSKDQSKRTEAINKAFAAGASAAVTAKEDANLFSRPDVFFADDIKATLKLALSQAYLPDLVPPILAAITGTNGKTSTAWYLSQILSLSGKPCAYLGTTGGNITGRTIPSRLTTPDVCDFYKFLAQARAVGCCAVAFEYSSHALDQDRLVNPDIQFTTFTNLTPDHLDYHGTMENYFAAKRKLFTGHTISSGENYAILNADDHYGRKLIDDPDVPRKKITYGFAADAHFKITQHQITPEGTTFQATWQGAKYQFETHLLGLPNIYNISAACTNAVLMGASADRLPEIITRLTPVPGRFETVPNTHGFRIIIDYAHTPDALEKLLVNVRNITPRRIICVFGCGGNRDATKRPVMGAIAEKNSDLPIITSDNPREEDPQAIISQILSGFSDRAKPLAIVCRRTAISEAIKRAEPGDTVVIAGKGHESTQEIRGVFYPFSDRAVVSEILEEMQ